MMLTIRVDGYELDLSPLQDVLELTQVNETVLNQLVTQPNSSGIGSNNSVWADDSFREQTAQRLAASIPKSISVDVLPSLPDQLASILRTELTLVTSQYPLESAEKDEAEQLLQDILRAIVYHLIDRHFAGKPVAEPKAMVADAISQTIVTSWPTIRAAEWNICPLDSMIGLIGFEFRAADQVVYSDYKMSSKGEFFYLLSMALTKTMCEIAFK